MSLLLLLSTYSDTFSPKSLFSNGQKGLFYDVADHAENTFQDTLGTIPATPGDEVGLVLDTSGNGLNGYASSNHPVLMPDRSLRAKDINSSLVVTLPALTSAKIYVNTPYGWYSSTVAGGGPYSIPLLDTTSVIILESPTLAQENSITTYFSTTVVVPGGIILRDWPLVVNESSIVLGA